MTNDELIAALRDRIDPGSPRRPAATVGDVDRAEERLGLRIPPLLRRIYLEIADGGFGPGCGILPLVPANPTDDMGVIETFEMFERPRPLLPFVDFGCACWGLVDTRTDDGTVILEDQGAPIDSGRSLGTFLGDWTRMADFDGSVFEPGMERMGINPFTKEPVRIRSRGCARGVRWADANLVPWLTDEP